MPMDHLIEQLARISKGFGWELGPSVRAYSSSSSKPEDSLLHLIALVLQLGG